MPEKKNIARMQAPATQIESRIFLIRGQKGMLDADLAELYGVETRALNQAVKRNAERFPEKFMFQLSAAEKVEVVTNCDHLARLKYSPSLPYVFTDHGAHDRAIVRLINAIRDLMSPAEPKTIEESIGGNLPSGYVGARKKRPIGFAPCKDNTPHSGLLRWRLTFRLCRSKK